jgi:opacity protein-like surface antigen
MKLPIVVASVLASSMAFAQAPGQVEPVAAGAPAPAPLTRWSVGVGFGGVSLAPHAMQDNPTDFHIAALAVRYRPWRHIELELSIAGGGEVERDGVTYDRTISEGVLAARYRFWPGQHFDGWLMAGFGALSIERPELDDEQRDKATKATLQLGAGVEYRWERFALQLEVRAVGVRRDEDEVNDYQDSSMTTTTYGADGWSGAQGVLSGNYYF